MRRRHHTGGFVRKHRSHTSLRRMIAAGLGEQLRDDAERLEDEFVRGGREREPGCGRIAKAGSQGVPGVATGAPMTEENPPRHPSDLRRVEGDDDRG